MGYYYGLAFSILLCFIYQRGCWAQTQRDEGVSIPPVDTNTEEGLNMKADDSPQATASDVPTGQLPVDDIGNIRELAPDFSHGVWDDTGKICLLAKFQASFSITYSAQGGDQVATVKMPEETKTKGVCASEKRDPVLQLLWPPQRPSFQFNVFFSMTPSTKKDQPSTWAVTSMELQYNTESQAIFVGATNVGLKTARTTENTSLFETPEGKSYFCNSPTVIHMINPKKERIVSARLQDVHIQPAGISKAKFSPTIRCSSVRIGGSIPEPYEDDETVPIAVGSTLAIVAVLVVIAYAIYKSFMVRRVDYSTVD